MTTGLKKIDHIFLKKLPPASKAKKMNGLPSATGASPEGNYFVNTMGLRRPFIFKSETVYVSTQCK